MAVNELKAVIKGDITDLEAKLKKADALLNQYERNISNVQNAIKKSTSQSNQYEKAISDLNNEFKSGAISEEKFEKENKQLTNSFAKSQKETRDFQKELDRLQKEADRVRHSFERVNKPLKDYPKSTDKATKSSAKFKKGTADGTATLTEFSRVIQDAPYGIQGVANNIQQLTSQFGYLQKRTGSAKGAFKALLSSFTGTGGIVFAVSVATSLLVTYGDKIFDLISPTNKLNDATKEYLSSAKSEITTLNQLVKIATDENNSKKVRQKAINELNSKYPEYFSNLDLEKGKTQEVADAVNKLSTALINQAKIKGVQDRIDGIFNDRQEEGTTLLERRQKAYEDLAKKIRFLNSQVGLGLNQEIINDAINNLDFSTLDDLIENIDKAKLSTRQLNQGVVGSFQDLFLKYKGASEASSDFDSETNTLISDLLKLQTALKEDYFENTPFKEGEEGIRKIQKAVTDLKHNSEIILDVKLSDKATKKDTPTFENPTILPEADMQALYDFQKELENTRALSLAVGSSIAQSFSAMGSSIVDSWDLADKGMEGFVKNLAKTVTDIISMLLANAIANAITAGSSASIAAPFAAPAFIATAVAGVVSAFAAIPSFTSGGIMGEGGIIGGGSFIGDKNLAFVNSGEMILNNKQQRNLFSMLNGNGITANYEPQLIVLDAVLKGEDIVLSSDRYNRNRGRRN